MTVQGFRNFLAGRLEGPDKVDQVKSATVEQFPTPGVTPAEEVQCRQCGEELVTREAGRLHTCYSIMDRWAPVPASITVPCTGRLTPRVTQCASGK